MGDKGQHRDGDDERVDERVAEHVRCGRDGLPWCSPPPSQYVPPSSPPSLLLSPLTWRAVYALNPAMYPALDRQPPVDSPQVLEWISKVNLAGAPKIAVNGINGCQNTSVNAAAIAAAGTNGNCECIFTPRRGQGLTSL